jgi:hypothetical protein
MTGRDGRYDAAHGKAESGGRPADRLPRLSLKRLLTIGGVVLLAAGTGGSMLCPFRVGWQRAAQLVALEDRCAALAQEKARLTKELAYRQTAGGKALEASRQFEMGRPGGRVVELLPKPAPARPKPRPTLSERAEALGERASGCAYGKWRVLVRYLFDKRLPPRRTT